MKFIPDTSSSGVIVVASYPNWLEVIRGCSGEFELDQSYWFGGLTKQNMLYLDYDNQKPERVFMVMGRRDAVVETRIRIDGCSE